MTGTEGKQERVWFWDIPEEVCVCVSRTHVLLFRCDSDLDTEELCF